MPIKIPNELPAAKTLTEENIFIMTETRAIKQDIRPLQIPAKFQESLLFVGTLTYDRINNGLWIGTNDGLFFYNFINAFYFIFNMNNI